MNISQKGIDLIKEFEGCVLHAYRDAVGIITIGYGTTNADSAIIGTTIYMGMTITQATAEAWLEKSVNAKYVPQVMKYDYIYHWNQNQLDALTSFAYNIGSIDQLTANGTRSIAEISNKILAYDKAGGQTLAGLTRRRKAEKALFDTPVQNSLASGEWVQTSKGWRYIVGTSPVRNRWINYNDKFYYLKANGYMASDEYIKSSMYKITQDLFYLNKDGSWDEETYRWKWSEIGWWLERDSDGWYPVKKWAVIDGRTYRFDSRGYMVYGRTVVIDGKKYTFSDDGVLQN